jgi:hypothetical protein
MLGNSVYTVLSIWPSASIYELFEYPIPEPRVYLICDRIVILNGSNVQISKSTQSSHNLVVLVPFLYLL